MALPFQQMFAGEVPMIGQADPTKAVGLDGKLVQTTGARQVLPSTVDEVTTGHGTGSNIGDSTASIGSKKGSKSRKKA